MDTGRYRHAVVIGGSMAGLAVTQALARHFDEVTLIDRDRFPATPAFRRGVPQSPHLHVLLGQGASMLERLFPGLLQELVEAGAVPIQWPRDALWLTAAGWSQRFPRGFDIVCCTRELLEWKVRQRVLANQGLRVLEGHDVVGFVLGSVPGTVGGVTYRLRGRDQDIASESVVDADLVVDASGRNSRLPTWLEALGYPAPAETTITSYLGYASRLYRIPPTHTADWKVLYLQGAASIPRGAGLFPMEDNRWIVTLVGFGDDAPPTDEEGFMEYARGIRSPALYDAIKDAEPLTPIRGYQRTENRLRHFHKLKRFPDNVLALGDAVYAFNPVYGQGMTVAAIEAVELDRLLQEQRQRHPDGRMAGLSRKVQQMANKAGAGAWLVATGEDLRSPLTVGAKPGLMTKLTHRYLDRVVRVALEDPVVNLAFLSVLQLSEPPARLFRRDVLFRTLQGPRHDTPDAPPSLTLGSQPELVPELPR